MTAMVTTTSVPIDGDDAGRTVALIALNDGKANALSTSAIAGIRAAISAAEADAMCVAAVVAGREGRFSAGFDLSVIRSGDPAAIVGLVADGGELVRHMYGATIPVVAACTGHAIAAGALVLLGCDVRIGGFGDYSIGLNEVAIGLTLPDWALTIARERLSRRHAQRAIVNAELYRPNDAVDAGFLDRAVPADEVLEVALATAKSMASLDPAAYASTIRAFRGQTLVTMSDQIAADRSRV